ncbi:MAG TPA: hypothetical protein VMS22_17615 [Candidatus Eisenbacteria bacterium]|nr:hypothetical protein [Candidatus Eisenbacteria bacterium]
MPRRRSLLLLLVLAAGIPRIALASPMTCQLRILRGTAALQQVVLTVLGQCEAKKRKGALPPDTVCRTEPKVAAVLGRAAERLGRTIGKACGGPNHTCGDDDDESLASIGWGIGSCPGLIGSSDPACTTPITSCSDIGTCIECVAFGSAERSLAPVYPASTPAKKVARCSRTIGKETGKLLFTRANIIANCLGDRLLGHHHDDCPNEGSTKLLQQAAARRVAAICKACGGRDHQCDGADDVAPPDLGFADTCPGTSVGCPPHVDSMRKLVECLDCSTTTSSDCADAVAAPAAGTYPDACQACCGPRRIVFTTDQGGTIDLGQPPTIPRLAGGIAIVLDTGPPDADCRHTLTVPADGFSANPFCVGSLTATAQLTATGCATGDGLGVGTFWDGKGTTADPNITKAADTSDGVCAPTGLVCSTAAGGAGADTLGAITTTFGGGTNVPQGLHFQFEMPGVLQIWQAADATCPDHDGTLNPGADTVLAEIHSAFSLTTGTGRARFTDANADGCSIAGSQPNNASIAGRPASGACCEVGRKMILVSAGAVFSGGPPYNDVLFRMTLPGTITACEPLQAPSTCTLPTDVCRGY